MTLFGQSREIVPNISVFAVTKQRKKLPFWIKHYWIGCYISFGLNLVVVFTYLGIVGHVLCMEKMYFQYHYVVNYHEANSYSLISPFTAFPILIILTYHVHYQTDLSDGDFLGILGLVLLMAGISFYDGIRLVYTNAFDLTNTIDSANLSEIESELLMKEFRKSAKQNVREWTHYLQRDLQCCGVNGVRDWRNFTKPVPWSCCPCNKGNCSGFACPSGASKPYKNGCALPLWEFLISINRRTYICMFLLAFVYVLNMIAYVFHWGAMRILKEHVLFHPKDDHPMSLRFTLEEIKTYGVGLSKPPSKSILKKTDSKTAPQKIPSKAPTSTTAVKTKDPIPKAEATTVPVPDKEPPPQPSKQRRSVELQEKPKVQKLPRQGSLDGTPDHNHGPDQPASGGHGRGKPRKPKPQIIEAEAENLP